MEIQRRPLALILQERLTAAFEEMDAYVTAVRTLSGENDKLKARIGELEADKAKLTKACDALEADLAIAQSEEGQAKAPSLN